MALTLSMLVGLIQVSPTHCQFELLHSNGDIDTHVVKCEYIIDGNILPIN
jgi:hypothetical protein